MLGLERVSGIAGSLLLNLEGPLTLFVGIVVVHEYLGRRAGIGSVAIFAGSAFIGLQGPTGGLDGLGGALVVVACLGWAIDNNLTQRLSVRDPFQIVAVKTGVAAVVNVGLAQARGEAIPGGGVLAGALLLGAAARPRPSPPRRSPGTLRAVPLLAERWTAGDLLAALAMAVGVVLLVGSRHDHEHTHEPHFHDHHHVHDEHHRHEHPDGVDPTEPHSHPHRHEPLVHSHTHVSDVHHRHGHEHG